MHRKQSAPCHWHAMTAADITDVDRIACLIHPTLPERPAVFAEKLALFPDGCRKLVCGTTMCGYGFTHPWALYATPPLDGLIGVLPETPQCLYIHDVAIMPEARGNNAACAYVDDMKQLARVMRIRMLALVSVYGTVPFWARSGFTVAHDDPAFARKLLLYGAEARYMICPVPAL